MATSLRHPDVRPAVPWLAASLAGTAMVTGAFPTDDAWWRPLPLGILVATCLVVGIVLSIRAIARGSARTLATWLLVGALLGLPVAAFLSLGGAFLLGPLVMVAPIALAIAGIVLLCVPRGADGDPAFAAVAAASAVSLGAVAIGVVDGLVWLPQTLAPGMALDAIYAELARQDEDAGLPVVVIWGVCGAVAIAAAALAALRHRLRPATAAAVVLAPAVGALLVLPWWEFTMGMSVSDALPPYTGGQSDAMAWIAVLVAVLAGAAAWGLTRPPEVAVAPGAGGGAHPFSPATAATVAPPPRTAP